MRRLSRTLIVRALSLLVFALSGSSLSAQETIVFEDPAKDDTYFIQHQFGANQGLYSLGLGYRWEIFEPSFSIGYTPNIKSGAQVVQGNIKTNWEVFEIKRPNIQLLLGTSLFINFSDKAFFRTPGKYPEKYYPPNAYFFGIQASIRHHGFFVEASIIDYFLEVAARNRNSASYITDLYSVGFGYVHDVDFEWSDLAFWD